MAKAKDKKTSSKSKKDSGKSTTTKLAKSAKKSGLMDLINSDLGREILADALIAAVKRGVAVRVLIDAVGARSSVPSIVGYLKEGGVPTAVFNGNIIMGLRLPYANLRTHRKIMVVDGAVAFAGGMNIRHT